MMRRPGRSIQQVLRGLGKELWGRIHARRAVRGVEAADPVLVYQMGKVGSSTVARTLETADPTRPVFQVHCLTREHYRAARRRQRTSVSPGLPEHLLLGQAVRRVLESTARRWPVVTLTRDPWARLVSFLFEDRWKQMPEAVRSDGSVDVSKAKVALDRMVRENAGIVDPSRWFDEELKATLGVDVFEAPYEFERGYSLIRSDRADVLIIRLEDVDRSLAPALAELLGLPEDDVRMVRANVGEKKRYADALAEAKASFAPPPALVERLVATRYYRHFYAVAPSPPAWARAVT